MFEGVESDKIFEGVESDKIFEGVESDKIFEGVESDKLKKIGEMEIVLMKIIQKYQKTGDIYIQ